MDSCFIETQLCKSYLADVPDAERVSAAPYLVLMDASAPKRRHDLGEIFNGLRYIVLTGMQLRYIPNDLSPWHTIYRPTRCWTEVGSSRRWFMTCAETRCRSTEPSAAILDCSTSQSTPESGGRTSYAGAKWKNGLQLRIAVDTPG